MSHEAWCCEVSSAYIIVQANEAQLIKLLAATDASSVAVIKVR